MQRNSLGKYGESLAQAFLQNLGYEILHTNWRYGRYGEVDIIAYQPRKQTLVFVEVKTRRNQSYGTPLEAVTPHKQQVIRQLAEVYIATQPLKYPFLNVSFDIISITPGHNGPPQLEHTESAF